MTNAKLAELLKPHKDLQKYLFVRGFLLTDRDDLNLNEFPFYGNWTREAIGNKYFAYVHCMQKVTSVENNGNIFFLFGHAYNPFTMQYDEKVVLERIAKSYGTDEYQSCVDEITGLFVFGVVKNDSEVEFLVDPAGIQSACYSVIDGNFYVTSHPQLIGDICNLEMGELVKELIKYKWYYRIMGPYLPADMTPFDEVKRIVPDASYTYKAGKVSHNRFYPIKELTECKDEKEYNEVIIQGADILKNNMKLITQKWKNPRISLTGGIDSNTTFAAGNGVYDKLKAFSYLSAEKETIDADAAKIIAKKFNVEHTVYNVPETTEDLKNYDELVAIIEHNNGYVAKGKSNEYRKRVYLLKNIDADVEIKSWVSETIRGYWYKYYRRKSMPKMSPKLFRNLYKIFIFNRGLAHKIDKVFAEFINEFEYDKIPSQYPIADMHYHEIGWGSWGSINISEMKIYSDITIIYNNRKFLDLLFKVPLEKRIADQHHLDMKKYLNKELYDMNIRVVNMKETNLRAFLLNVIFTINSYLPF
ncbi:MAG: asparagine synthase-related protein [Acutalibacteraceae bacterium]|nr:asparagine synthase-related protein [Acutalibacteraceae bacterium]